MRWPVGCRAVFVVVFAFVGFWGHEAEGFEVGGWGAFDAFEGRSYGEGEGEEEREGEEEGEAHGGRECRV